MDFEAKMLRDDALKGKTIVVTGGGSGLGKAMTTYFLELGANVIITSRNIEKLFQFHNFKYLLLMCEITLYSKCFSID